MKFGKLLIFTGLVIALTFPILWMIFMEIKVIGEVPCVDGRNRVNLEGIMCEETQYSLFGYGPLPIIVTIIILGIAGLWIYHRGLYLDDEERLTSFEPLMEVKSK